MAICCGGKKQKASYSVTSSLNKRRSSLKSTHAVTLDHHPQQHSSLKSNASSSSTRPRSHSHFNHRPSTASQSATPHDPSHASAGSASSSTMNGMTKNHDRLKVTTAPHPMDANDDREDEQQRSTTTHLNRSFGTQQQHSIVHSEMIFYCFEILGNHLFHGKHQSASTYGQLIPASVVPPRLPSKLYPLFVTWLIGSEQKLRGCIGTFTPMSLTQGLREYALTSATNDSRFPPISRDEYPLLSCAVSILTDFEPCSSYSDWAIGIHGIRIEFFNERGSKRSATYLPEVASEQGWNHVETLDSLLRKGGYRASITSDMRKSVHVVRYRSEKLTLHHNDFVKSRINSPSTSATNRPTRS